MKAYRWNCKSGCFANHFISLVAGYDKMHKINKKLVENICLCI
ncbi:hypothetical protein CLOL250_01966 [Clostridium sp. L2-50]|nr:hypothetical protein CLOL250_01966 [Clostridium sp. L2-50]